MIMRLNHLKHLPPYFLIAAVALLCHGLLLLNDGTYWDDWLLKSYLVESNWDALHDMATEMGLPILAHFFWTLTLTGLLGFYKFIAFLSILFSAFLVYRLALQFNWFTRPIRLQWL